jgi:hypothetical protein
MKNKLINKIIPILFSGIMLLLSCSADPLPLPDNLSGDLENITLIDCAGGTPLNNGTIMVPDFNPDVGDYSIENALFLNTASNEFCPYGSCDTYDACLEIVAKSSNVEISINNMGICNGDGNGNVSQSCDMVRLIQPFGITVTRIYDLSSKSYTLTVIP